MSDPHDQPKQSNFPQEPGAPPDRPVLHYRTPLAKRPRTSSGWQIAGGFAIYQVSIIGLTATYPTFVPVWKSLTEWLVLTALLVFGTIGVGVRWNKWGYLKGVIAAFILTGSCCGLLYSSCGNPFQPLL
jgi:hypothetical protein